MKNITLLVWVGECNELVTSEKGPRGKPSQPHMLPRVEAQRTPNSPRGIGFPLPHTHTQTVFWICCAWIKTIIIIYNTVSVYSCILWYDSMFIFLLEIKCTWANLKIHGKVYSSVSLADKDLYQISPYIVFDLWN